MRGCADTIHPMKLKSQMLGAGHAGPLSKSRDMCVKADDRRVTPTTAYKFSEFASLRRIDT